MPLPPIPFAPGRIYDTAPGAVRIADLILRRGDAQAYGAGQAGMMWANAVRDIGQIAGQAVQQHQEQKAQQKREQYVNQIMQSWDGQDPQSLFKGLAPVLGPESAIKVASGLSSLMAARQKQQPDQKDLAGIVGGLAALEKSSEGYMKRHWQTVAPTLAPVAKMFGMELPPEYTPEVARAIMALDQQFNPGKSEEYTLTPGAKRFRGSEVIAEVPLAEKPTTLAEAALKGDNAAYQALLKVERDKAAAGRAPEAPDAGLALTAPALDVAARRYLTDGTLPAMGMGKQGAAARQAIINRAAELDPAADIAGNRAGYEANKGSLTAMQKMVDAVTAFESTASKNAKLLDGLLDKIPNYGNRYANRPARELSQAFGSDDMTSFNTLRQSVANEYARIISNPALSGVMSDSAREEGNALLDPNATPSQIRSALKTLAAEAKNRHTEYQGQLDSIRGRIGGRPGSKQEDGGWIDMGGGIRIREKK